MSSHTQNPSHHHGNGETSFSDKTTFGTIHRFPKLDESKIINTEQFLQACRDVTAILDRLGTQFSLAKKDMLGNIKRIEDRLKTNPTLYVTLNSILDEDSKASQKFTSAVIGILWLKRGLQFLQAFILGLAKEFHNHVQEENMRNIVLAAYETTLKPYHGKVSRFLFANLTRFVPYRSNFIKALMLSDDATVEMLFSDIDLYITDFTENLDLIEYLLNQHGLNSEEKS